MSVRKQSLTTVSVAFLAITMAAAEPPDSTVHNTSFSDPSGQRVLQFTATVHAPALRVWTALTNAAEYKKWGASVVFIDLRIGGVFEAGYNPKARSGDSDNVRHEIISYLPTRMIVFRNLQAPVGPAAEAYKKLQIIVLLNERVDGNTDVSLADIGFQPGADFDNLYAFFAQHNPEYLERLAAFLDSGRQ
jgi:uncharacterized protein YndB with AHSA1/START domain